MEKKLGKIERVTFGYGGYLEGFNWSTMRMEELSDKDLLKLYNISKKDINSQSKSIGVKLMEEEIKKRNINSCYVCEGVAIKKVHTAEDRGFFYLCEKVECKTKLETILFHS